MNEKPSIYSSIENSQLYGIEDISLRKKIKILEKKCLELEEDNEILTEENYELRRKLDQYSKQ
jgi:hypothetical protein